MRQYKLTDREAIWYAQHGKSLGGNIFLMDRAPNNWKLAVGDELYVGEYLELHRIAKVHGGSLIRPKKSSLFG